ncbi:MAG1140 family protein [Mesomycoplasma molare]|uniref:Uncharacterized protein n=1 Tax=Mesomycoplasma molare TaxID=171288 RepID=A0ABY5TWS9_9BACT|nr:hypothetical protein [Mesomycoplasma molare]UWD34441.1 hypothetical protein NX772_01260 [Mesomycoplasma molare]
MIKNRILISISCVLLLLFIISLFLIKNIDLNEKINVKIQVDEKRNLYFNVNSNIYFLIKKKNWVLVDKLYSKNGQNIILKIREIKNIKNDLFNVSLIYNNNLKIVPNSIIEGYLILNKKVNIINLII